MSERAQALEAIEQMLSYMVVNAADRRVLSAEIALAVYGPPPAGPLRRPDTGPLAPAVGVSPQPDDSTPDMGHGWFVTVGRWGDSLVTIEERCLSGKDGLTDEDCELLRGAALHLQSFAGRRHRVPDGWIPTDGCDCDKCNAARLRSPATVSLVEPTNTLGDHRCCGCGQPCDCCQPSACNICSKCARKWPVNPHAPEPVEPTPEPPTHPQPPQQTERAHPEALSRRRLTASGWHGAKASTPPWHSH